MNQPKSRVGFEIERQNAFRMTARAVCLSRDRIFVVVEKPAEIRVFGGVNLG